jgi:hypothetical protein
LFNPTAVVVTAINLPAATAVADLTIDNCEFRDGSSTLNFVNIVTSGTTAATNGFNFTNNRVSVLADTSNIQVVTIGTLSDRMTFQGNVVMAGAVVTGTKPAFIGLGTSLNHTNLLIKDNLVVTARTNSTGGVAVGGSGTMTGLATGNRIGTNTAGATTIWIPTSLGLNYDQNYCQVTGAADKSALINPAAV